METSIDFNDGNFNILSLEELGIFIPNVTSFNYDDSIILYKNGIYDIQIKKYVSDGDFLSDEESKYGYLTIYRIELIFPKEFDAAIYTRDSIITMILNFKNITCYEGYSKIINVDMKYKCELKMSTLELLNKMSIELN